MTEARNESLWRSARPLVALGAVLALTLVAGCADDEVPSAEVPGGGGSGGSGQAGAGGGGAGKAGSAGKAGGGAGGAAGHAGSGTGGGGAAQGGGGTGGGGAAQGGGGTGGGGAAQGGGGAGGGGAGGGGAGGMNVGGMNVGGAGAGGGGAGGAGAGGVAGGGAGGMAGAGGGGAGGSPMMCGTPTGDGTIATVQATIDGASGSFVSPFDATPSADGCLVFFTAIDVASGNAAVYRANADGTGLTMISKPDGTLIAPTGIAVSTDGATVYVADVGAAQDPTPGGSIATDDGRLFSMPANGGALSSLVDGSGPRSVTVWHDPVGNTDTIFYGGHDAMGAGAIFKMTGGTSPSVVMSGFGADPSGIAVSLDGNTIYAIDTTSGSGRGAVYRSIAAMAPTLVAGNLPIGYPTGLALAGDQATLIFSGFTPAGADALVQIDVTGMVVKNAQQPGTLGNFVDIGGAHRATNVEVYATVDGLGPTGSGAVYVLTP